MAYYLAYYLPSCLVLVLFTASIIAPFIILVKKFRYWPVAVLGASFLAGIAAGSRATPREISGETGQALEIGDVIVEGVVSSSPLRRDHGLRLEVNVRKIIVPPQNRAISFPRKIRVHVSGGEGRDLVEEGETLWMKGLSHLKMSGKRNPDVKQMRPAGRTSFSVSERDILHRKGRKGIFQAARNALSEKLAGRIPERSAALAEAIVAGRKEKIPEDVAERFRNSGLAHLLAVSGLHLSATALLVMQLMKILFSRIPAVACRVPAQWISTLLSLPLIWLFALFASARPPVLRAAIMVSACQIAMIAGKRSCLPQALAMSALFLLVKEPENLWSASFLLSFSAVAGIFLFSGRIKAIIEKRILKVCPWDREERGFFKKALIKLRSFATDVTSVSTAATISTLPVTCFFFERVPLVAIACNVAGVPIFSFLVLPANMIYCVMLLLFGGAPGFASSLLDAMNSCFLWFVHLCGAVPPIEIESLLAAPAALLLIISFTLFFAGMRRKIAAILAALAVVLALAPPVFVNARRYVLTRGRMAVVFAEVGQGDCALIRTPEKKHLLIDAGPPEGHGLLELLKPWTSRIDLLVITHGHVDHYGGAEALLESNIEVREIWVNPQGMEEREDLHYLGLLDRFRKRGTEVVVGPGCSARRMGGIELLVLAPCDPEGYDFLLDWNNNSIVVHARLGRAGFLFTGDIEREGEEKVASRRDMSSAVIKVPHHGSARASSEIITGWNGARIGVVSAGAGNKFGLPHPRVLGDFRRAGVEVLRVDKDGAWIIVTDGRKITARDWRWKIVREIEAI